MKLFRIDLAAGDHPGMDFNYLQGTGNDKFWLPDGYDGIWVNGAGRDVTHVRAGLGVWEGINVASTVKRLQLTNLTVHGGLEVGIRAGMDTVAQQTHKGMELRLVNFKLVMHKRPPEFSADGTRPAWPLFLYHTDVYAQDFEIDGSVCREHPYMHGFWKFGCHIYRGIIRSGGQAWKIATRPGPMYYPEGVAPGPHAYIDGCHPSPEADLIARDIAIVSHGEPWCARGGGGFVLEGPGLRDVSLERCTSVHTGKPMAWNPKIHSYPGLALDKGGGEYFGAGETVAGIGPAVRSIDARQCVFGAIGREEAWGDHIQDAVYLVGAGAALFKECGVYGPQTKLTWKDAPEDALRVEGCNTDKIRDLVSFHWPVVGSEETCIHLGGFPPVSEGWTSEVVFEG